MARFVVIGLGKFGSIVARSLYDKGHEVMAIDSDKERVQDVRDHSTQAVVADCVDPEALTALGIQSADAVIVSLGEKMDASILATLYLRELGVSRILVKAVSEDHGKVLRLVGASEVIHPERDTALRLAVTLGTSTIHEYLPLGVGFSLLELGAPANIVGRTLGELQIRTRFHVLAVAVKNGDALSLVPGADYAVREGDVLVLIGTDQDLEAVGRLAR